MAKGIQNKNWIPDIWSDTLQDKINTAYAYGEAKKTGGGLTLAKAELSNIIGQPVQYAAVIDFSKFETLIDFFNYNTQAAVKITDDIHTEGSAVVAVLPY